MKKLAILVNVIAPYRIPVLASLARDFETLVLHGGTEPNRTWTLELPPTLKTRKVFTLKMPVRKKTGVDGVSDTTYLHFNIGLVWWLLRFRPEVIITGEMGLRTVMAAVYGKLTRTPVWVWWGGTIHSERNVSNSKRVLRRVLARHIGHWISYGSTTTEYLETIGVTRKNILQIQNCVPETIFQTTPLNPRDWFKDKPRPVIFSVGQLVPRKGLDKLIEACGRLRSRGLQFTLVLVGQGPERERLQELAREQGIDNFEILPNQTQPTLNEMYRAADVFVFPTLEDIWGLVVNEAMWAGAPVFCSKYAGCAPELLPNSNIFDPLSAESFDSALTMIFEGRVCAPDQSRLKTCEEVSDMIRLSLQAGFPTGGRHLNKKSGAHSHDSMSARSKDKSLAS